MFDSSKRYIFYTITLRVVRKIVCVCVRERETERERERERDYSSIRRRLQQFWPVIIQDLSRTVAGESTLCYM